MDFAFERDKIAWWQVYEICANIFLLKWPRGPLENAPRVKYGPRARVGGPLSQGRVIYNEFEEAGGATAAKIKMHISIITRTL